MRYVIHTFYYDQVIDKIHIWKSCKIFASTCILIATHLKIIVKRHMIIIQQVNNFFKFDDFHCFSMTFPGKMPFFQANIKFNDLSRQYLNSITFPGLCEPCFLCFVEDWYQWIYQFSLGLIHCHWVNSSAINTLRQRQNGRHFADDTFKSIFLNENVIIAIQISLKFVLRVQLTIFQHWFR